MHESLILDIVASVAKRIATDLIRQNTRVLQARGEAFRKLQKKYAVPSECGEKVVPLLVYFPGMQAGLAQQHGKCCTSTCL